MMVMDMMIMMMMITDVLMMMITERMMMIMMVLKIKAGCGHQMQGCASDRKNKGEH